MTDVPDARLLEEFARNGSEEAFAALVQRHIALVHSVALRHTANPQHAQDITQAVFIILAREAGTLGRKTVLPGWLCRTARYASANALTVQRRRQRREQEAHMQSVWNEPESGDWNRIAPLLDDALARLSQKDHDAVVLRFFENKSLGEVGTAIGASEDTARMRVNRAVAKLRKYFLQRGVDSTAAAIAENISTHSVQAAPVALAKTVTAVALAKGAAAGGSTLTLVKGALKIMAWTKAKTAIVVGVSVLLTAGTTVTIKEIEARDAWRVWPGDLAALNRVPHQVRILPAKFPKSGWNGANGGKMMGIGQTIGSMAQVAFASPSERNWDDARTIVSANVPQGRYDFIANLPTGSWIALQKELERKLGVVARRETRETDVLQLTVKRPNAPGLKPSAAREGGYSGGASEVKGTGSSMNDVAVLLERQGLGLPVVDHTGLTGKFDFDLKWNRNDPEHDSLKQALLDQLGLELVPDREPIEMLVVEKAGN